MLHHVFLDLSVAEACKCSGPYGVLLGLLSFKQVAKRHLEILVDWCLEVKSSELLRWI